MVSQTYIYGSTVVGLPYLSPMKNSLLVSMKYNNGSIKSFEYAKSTLSHIANMNLDVASAGIYIPRYDIYIYHTSVEYLIYDPSIQNSSAHYLGYYNPPTAFPESIKYLYTKDNL